MQRAAAKRGRKIDLIGVGIAMESACLAPMRMARPLTANNIHRYHRGNCLMHTPPRCLTDSECVSHLRHHSVECGALQQLLRLILCTAVPSEQSAPRKRSRRV